MTPSSRPRYDSSEPPPIERSGPLEPRRVPPWVVEWSVVLGALVLVLGVLWLVASGATDWRAVVVWGAVGVVLLLLAREGWLLWRGR